MPALQLGAALRHFHRLFNEGTVRSLTDAELLDRFLGRRDEAAFSAIVERHGPMVLGVCRATLKDPDDAPRVAERLRLWLDAQPGWRALGLCDSPVAGGDGNREFLLAGAKDR